MSALAPKGKAPVHDVLLSVQQASERLRLTPKTLRNWLCARRIGAIRVGRRVSIPESEVLRLLAEGWEPPVRLWGPNGGGR